MSERWATFDCYGTLIDWPGGIRAQLARLWPGQDARRAAPHATTRSNPASRKAEASRTARSWPRPSPGSPRQKGCSIPDGEADALATSLPSWKVFPEVPGSLTELRDRGWKLAILSNTDADLLDASLTAIGVPVDRRVVASEVGSYKPAFGHWETFFRETGAERTRHIHVAASLFHDIEPAAKLGLPAVWINRLGETSMVPRSAELPDLTQLPDTLDRLVPA